MQTDPILHYLLYLHFVWGKLSHTSYQQPIYSKRTNQQYFGTIQAFQWSGWNISIIVLVNLVFSARWFTFYNELHILCDWWPSVYDTLVCSCIICPHIHDFQVPITRVRMVNPVTILIENVCAVAYSCAVLTQPYYLSRTRNAIQQRPLMSNKDINEKKPAQYSKVQNRTVQYRTGQKAQDTTVQYTN